MTALCPHPHEKGEESMIAPCYPPEMGEDDIIVLHPPPAINDWPLKTNKLIYWIKILLRYSYWISDAFFYICNNFNVSNK